MLDFSKVFSEDYFSNELVEFAIKPITKGNCEVKYVAISGRIDAYCHSMYLKKKIKVPILEIDGVVYMSITPMEVQSHVLPIAMAEGRVGVGGLGLGYYVQSILKFACVDEVIVYETNQGVIDIYLENFGLHEKLKIVKQDVRSVEGEYFNFFYNDIYPVLLDNEVYNDMVRLCQKNEISNYHYWTYEMALLEMLNEGYMEIDILNSIAGELYYSPFLSAMIKEKSRFIKTYDMGEELFEKHQFAMDNL